MDPAIGSGIQKVMLQHRLQVKFPANVDPTICPLGKRTRPRHKLLRPMWPDVTAAFSWNLQSSDAAVNGVSTRNGELVPRPSWNIPCDVYCDCGLMLGQDEVRKAPNDT